MHQIVATVNGEKKVLVETVFCDSAFDYFCLFLRDYEWNQLEIAGDCNDDPTDSEHW